MKGWERKRDGKEWKMMEKREVRRKMEEKVEEKCEGKVGNGNGKVAKCIRRGRQGEGMGGKRDGKEWKGMGEKEVSGEV